MLGGKLCAHISPYRMLPLTHGRGQRTFVQLWRLRRPAVRACTEPELTTYARAPCACRLWSSTSRRVFQRGGLSQRGARVAEPSTLFRSLLQSRVGAVGQVAHGGSDCARLSHAQAMFFGAFRTYARWCIRNGAACCAVWSQTGARAIRNRATVVLKKC